MICIGNHVTKRLGRSREARNQGTGSILEPDNRFWGLLDSFHKHGWRSYDSTRPPPTECGPDSNSDVDAMWGWSLSLDKKNGFAQIFSLQTCRKNVKPWSKYGGKDGKCHICIPNNRECKYLGKWGICRLCSRFTPQFFHFAAYVPEANLFKSIFPSSVLRREVFPRVLRFSFLPP